MYVDNGHISTRLIYWFFFQENIDLLCKELRTPKYGAYFIYFTNRIDRGSIEKLALSDDQESVREVKVRERRKRGREREGGRR